MQHEEPGGQQDISAQTIGFSLERSEASVLWTEKHRFTVRVEILKQLGIARIGVAINAHAPECEIRIFSSSKVTVDQVREMLDGKISRVGTLRWKESVERTDDWRATKTVDVETVVQEPALAELSSVA